MKGMKFLLRSGCLTLVKDYLMCDIRFRTVSVKY
jgi:hypothetical protein